MVDMVTMLMEEENPTVLTAVVNSMPTEEDLPTVLTGEVNRKTMPMPVRNMGIMMMIMDVKRRRSRRPALNVVAVAS